MNRFISFLLRSLTAVAILFVLVAAVFLGVDYFKTREAFPPRTFISNVDVSLLTRQQAIYKLKRTPVQELFAYTVIFTNHKEKFIFPVEELGIHILAEKTVDNAFRLTHNEHYVDDLRKRLAREALILPIKLDLDVRLARELISELAMNIDSTPRDARIELNEKTGGYHIYPDLPARKLKIADTLKAARKALYQGKTNLPLLIDYYAEPRVKEADLRAAPPVYLLSAYTTYYGTHDSPNRIHNIKLIASWLNNTLLLSGETFSVAETIGDFTAEKGFKEAFVIMGGELVPELGGGTCQIGTTLYNAIALADIKVLSRRNHSFYFNIYPLGRDAAIYPGVVDLKFVNNTCNPILIKSYADNRKLSFRIYGTPTGKKVSFSTPEVLLLDNEGVFQPSSIKEAIKVDRPFRTIVTRTVKDSDGKLIEEETIRSYYKLYGEKTNVPIKRPEPR